MPLYLHATTSAVLVGMSHSQFSLISPDKLIAEYGVAPITGEISAGGQVGATVSSGIAFAKHGDQYWNLGSLLNSYGKYNWKKGSLTVESIIADVTKDAENDLTYIRETLIHLMRSCHMGEHIGLNQNVIEDLFEKLDSALTRVKRYYIRNYLVTRYLQTGTMTGFEASDVQLTFLDYLVDHIPTNFLSQSDLERKTFLDTLETLFQNSLKEHIYHIEVSSEFSDYFYITDSASYTDKKASFREFAFSTAMIYPTRKDFLNYIFYSEDEFKANYRVDDEKLKSEIEKASNQVTDLVNQLKKAIAGEVIEFTEEEKNLCVNTFTLIFLLDVEEDTKLLNPVKYEFRSTRPLQLGADIKKIATASENIATVKQFLANHGVENVEVVSIDSLKAQPSPVAPQAFFQPGQQELGHKVRGNAFTY